MIFEQKGQTLVCEHRGEKLYIEPWGADSLRVRATMRAEKPEKCWALTEEPAPSECEIQIAAETWTRDDGVPEERPLACIRNGRIQARVNYAGVISFEKDGEMFLREYSRAYEGALTRESRCLRVQGREWKGVPGADSYSLAVRFEAGEERLFGMGQYQQKRMNMKGCILELAQRNSQVSVPFALSSKGYGFLWNNPAVGKAVFGENFYEWSAASTKTMDYWVTVGESPRRILENYTAVTGRAPEFPEDLLGLWQCKLRYRTQDEVLEVARKHRDEGLKLDLIVIDFFHWTVQGDWKFDEKYWPDPKAMVDELHSMGVKVMVSVWPSVDKRSENYQKMMDEGLLIRTDRGGAQTYDYQGDCAEIDVFNPKAREYVFRVCRENYGDLGIDAFWLDNSEPDLVAYDFDLFRYCDGPALELSNLYPQLLSRAFYEGMLAAGWEQPVNLLRCGWAGSQKYGNVLWSGDVPSTFESFEDQVQCGLNMGIAGIPWWTTDIGGFMTDDWEDPEFQELLIRWYQYAVYSPVLRMHGNRGPLNIPRLDDRDWGGGYLFTGHPNEMWSYGEENYSIMRRYYDLRVAMKEYIASLFGEAHQTGCPLMRAMFLEFPEDSVCWELQDQYMFGSKYLAAPIMHSQEFRRSVYLPKGRWRLTSGGELFDGGRWIEVEAPLEYMPVLERLDLPE